MMKSFGSDLRCGWVLSLCILSALVARAESVTSYQRYDSIDLDTISNYAAEWARLHSNWISIDPNAKFCDEATQSTTYPLCFDNYLISEAFVDTQLESDLLCPAAKCLSKDTSTHMCSFTPFDSIDYLPPAATTSLDSTSICHIPAEITSGGDPEISSFSYGLDQGIPPTYLPIQPVRLNIDGTVTTIADGTACVPIANAEITAWQVDPTKLTQYSTDQQFRHRIDVAAQLKATRLGTPFSKTTTGGVITPTVQTEMAAPRNVSLRDVSSRATQHTTDTGAYSFQTLMPPSYGPPRHIMFQVSAPGYETLTTRMYFDRDWRLQQLTTQGGNTDSDSPLSPDSLPIALGFTGDRNYTMKQFLNAVVNKDPRVAKLKFRSTATTTALSKTVRGVLETNFNFVLRPTRPNLIEATTALSADGSTHSLAATTSSRDLSGMPAIDLNGIWADNEGALVRIETHGPSFIAREYPHPRTWGSTIGVLAGGVVRGVDFRRVVSKNDVEAAAQRRNNPQVDLHPSSTTWTAAGPSTGTIVPADPFATDTFAPQSPQAVSIQWAGGAYENLWTKQPDTTEAVRGYRYLKLLVSRETGGRAGGTLVLNEIEFFQGILSQDQRPVDKMTTPRFPVPQLVTCSSFLNQDYHCYKAFDGDNSSHSAWVTQPVGSRRTSLSSAQWVTFDFGEGRGVNPTAMRIVCDAQDAEKNARGCPRTFTLSGSHDNTKFDVLYKQDLFDYGNQYGPHGIMFYFVYDTVKGRPTGQRCGSCSTGPGFTCALDAYDGTCDTRYCGQNALCSEEPACPEGEYMHHGFRGYSQPFFQCKQCAPGRYGAVTGLRSPACSGLCAEGYFCPAGSTSNTSFPCGGAMFYCPEGSARPIPAAAGRVTLSRADLDRLAKGSTHFTPQYTPSVEHSSVRVAEQLCPRGHYCTQGNIIPCPVGRYGNTTGLQDSECNFACQAGDYCPAGSILPTICPLGHYCPDGMTTVVCPAGTYGDQTGLKDRQCSGYCHAGYYCLPGSVVPTSDPCPAGTYGDVAGLRNSSCSGLCAAGYYCPSGSAHFRETVCGDASVYCPEGSALPTDVSPGYYTIGGTSDRTRTAQTVAEAGFYATEGVKWPCRAGTYGEKTGLDADAFLFRTFAPSAVPSATPTAVPTRTPSRMPTAIPSAVPSAVPSNIPSCKPTVANSPTFLPTTKPTAGSTRPPTLQPSLPPTKAPSLAPSSLQPSLPPTRAPSAAPSTKPPSLSPTLAPVTVAPTRLPSVAPTCSPSATPKPTATAAPSTARPSNPSVAPTFQPSTRSPTAKPTTAAPTRLPSAKPSAKPTISPQPSFAPTSPKPTYSMSPSAVPSFLLLVTPSPTSSPSNEEELPYMDYTCSGLCALGHYCPRNTTVQVPCPAGRYGKTQGLTSDQCTAACPLGHYCVQGSVLPVECPPGVFGNTTGLTDATCSAACWSGGCSPTTNLCHEGYYCPSGSISGTQVQCGGADRYCPRGSSAPVSVAQGYYSIGRGDNFVTNTADSSDRAATRDTTSFHTRVAQTICEEGHYCIGGIKRNCPPGVFGSSKGLFSASCSGPCAMGYYCPEGSVNATTHKCPAGRYGATTNLGDSSCSGLCAAGYHCAPASTSATQLECAVLKREGVFKANIGVPSGPMLIKANQTADQATIRSDVYLRTFNTTTYYLPNTNRTEVQITEANAVFCPEGAATPLIVRKGYYAQGGNRTTRSSQLPCPMGSYCINGVLSSCPAGRYGRAARLSSPLCTGVCSKGHYCPAGSISSTQKTCPLGRYGSTEGLTTASCTGPCGHPLDCAAGSTTSTG